jgi:hypothetical protein
MNRLFHLLLLLPLLSLLSCQPAGPEDPDTEAWVDLFNGRDLTGWTPKIRGYELGENPGNTFRVVDSFLTVSYEAYDSFPEQFGHIFYETPFSYYRLRAEYRFIGEQAPGGPGWAYRNSGLMLHCQPPETMGVDQDFPISIEVQLLGGAEEGERSTCNLCTPGTHVYMADTLTTRHCINSRSATYRGDQWVTAEVLMLGDSLVEHYVNGDRVLEYTRPQIGGGNVDELQPGFVKEDGKLLESGYISLQSESHPIQFRKVQLLNLKGCMDPKARNYKSYYVQADDSACVY